MNTAVGYLDRLRNPSLISDAKKVRSSAAVSSGVPVVGAYYTNLGAGVAPEKEYWQLVDGYKSWTYTCIDKLGKSIAMIPLKLYIYRSKQTGKVIRDIQWKANFRMLERDEDRKYFLKGLNLEREELMEHPFLELIQRPNRFMTRFTLWYNTIIRLELSGLCGWLKLRDNLNVTRQILPLPLTKWATLRAKVTTTADLDYWEYRDGEVIQKFTPEQVFPMIYPHPASPFQGMSPLMAQTYPYDIDLFLMQQQRAFFEHGATPGLHLSTDQNLRKEQVDELREVIREQYSGALKAGDTLITHSGLKATAIGQTSRQSMIDEVARFARDKLITGFDLSPAKIGLVEDVNRANMAGLDRTFIHECLRPKCMLIEESIETFMLPDYDEGLTCDFELPSTEDQEYELKAMETRLRTKVTVVNQERNKLGMEDVDWGERPWGSFTDVQLTEGGTAAPKPAPTNGDGKRLLTKQADASFWTGKRKDTYWKTFAQSEESLEQIFLFPLQRHFKAQCEEVIQRLNREWNKVVGQYSGWSRRRVRQHLKENKTNLRAININEKDEREVLVEKFTPVVQTIMKEYGDVRIEALNFTGKAADRGEGKAIAVEFNVNDPGVLKWLGSKMEAFSKTVAGTTFDGIESILREGFAEGDSIVTVSETLRQKFEGWEQYRAPLIARTETIAAMNKSDLESVRQLELEDQLQKHWLSSRDDNTRETHLAADKEYEVEGIKIDEEFDVGQDRMEAPGLGSLAEENINCRCTIYYTETEVEMEAEVPDFDQVVDDLDERGITLREPIDMDKDNAKLIESSNIVLDEIKSCNNLINLDVEKIRRFDIVLENKGSLIQKDSNIQLQGYWNPYKDELHLAIDKEFKVGNELTPGGFLVDSNFQGAIRHEYGHAIFSEALSPKQCDAWTKLYNEIDSTVIKEGVSQYAATNRLEAWAESFSYWTSSGYASETSLYLPTKIETFFTGIFGKRGG